MRFLIDVPGGGGFNLGIDAFDFGTNRRSRVSRRGGPALRAGSAGGEQRNHNPSVRIDAGQVGCFVRVASITCERETGRVVRLPVLLRQNVLQVKRN